MSAEVLMDTPQVVQAGAELVVEEKSPANFMEYTTSIREQITLLEGPGLGADLTILRNFIDNLEQEGRSLPRILNAIPREEHEGRKGKEAIDLLALNLDDDGHKIVDELIEGFLEDIPESKVSILQVMPGGSLTEFSFPFARARRGGLYKAPEKELMGVVYRFAIQVPDAPVSVRYKLRSGVRNI